MKHVPYILGFVCGALFGGIILYWIGDEILAILRRWALTIE